LSNEVDASGVPGFSGEQAGDLIAAMVRMISFDARDA